MTMKFSEYLDSAENAGDEEKVLQQFSAIKEELAQQKLTKTQLEILYKLPLLGKIMKAIIALGDAESIEAFRQSEHYATIKDWNTIVHDFGIENVPNITMYPSDAQMAKLFKVLAVIFGGVLLLLLCRKRCCKRSV